MIYYSDLVSAISLSGPVVRLDFGAKNAGKQGDGNPPVDSVCSVCLPYDVLANILPQLEKLVQKLESDGILKKKQHSVAKSPNFN